MRPRFSRAFIIMDAVMALCILGVLMTLMAVGLSANQRTTQRLANSRAACSAAETALTDLQQGNPVSPADVRIDRLDGGSVIPDFTWVRITATVRGSRASLTGLAKSTALKGS